MSENIERFSEKNASCVKHYYNQIITSEQTFNTVHLPFSVVYPVAPSYAAEILH